MMFATHSPISACVKEMRKTTNTLEFLSEELDFLNEGNVLAGEKTDEARFQKNLRFVALIKELAEARKNIDHKGLMDVVESIEDKYDIRDGEYKALCDAARVLYLQTRAAHMTSHIFQAETERLVWSAEVVVDETRLLHEVDQDEMRTLVMRNRELQNENDVLVNHLLYSRSDIQSQKKGKKRKAEEKKVVWKWNSKIAKFERIFPLCMDGCFMRRAW